MTDTLKAAKITKRLYNSPFHGLTDIYICCFITKTMFSCKWTIFFAWLWKCKAEKCWGYDLDLLGSRDVVVTFLLVVNDDRCNVIESCV